jgi:hypothetical protein
MTTTQSVTELRRRARAEGLTLIKYRESSRWYHDYGPYALIDAVSNCVVARGMDREAVARELTGT